MNEHDTPSEGVEPTQNPEPDATPGAVPDPEHAPAPAPIPMPDTIMVGEDVPSEMPPPPTSDTEAGEPRRLGAGWKMLIALAVLMALTAIGVGWWLYYETTQARNEAVALLDEATALVERADAVVLAVDEVVRAEIDAEVGERAAALAGRLPEAREDLSSAVLLIGQAQSDLPESEFLYAQALDESARARLIMLEKADVILEYNVKAAAALGPASEAWALIVEAGGLSVQAVEEYNKLTREAVTRSAELTREADEKVKAARTLFSVAATGFPEVDFDPYFEYCDEKTAALALSKKADEAYLADKPAEANTLSTQYNDAEVALADKAAALPASPAELVADAYERYAAEATEDYFDARAQATEADGRLREAAGEELPAGGDAESDDATSSPGSGSV